MLVVSLFYIGSATRRWWPAGPQKFMVVYHITLYFTLKKRNPNFRSISRRMTSRYDGRVWFQNYFHSQHPWLSTNYFTYLQVPLPHLSHPPILWHPPPCPPVGIFTSNLESVTNFLEQKNVWRWKRVQSPTGFLCLLFGQHVHCFVLQYGRRDVMRLLASRSSNTTTSSCSQSFPWKKGEESWGPG